MMEEKFNVDYTVDWVPGDTYAQKMELVLSSGELPDLMQIQTLPYQVSRKPWRQERFMI